LYRRIRNDPSLAIGQCVGAVIQVLSTCSRGHRKRRPWNAFHLWRRAAD